MSRVNPDFTHRYMYMGQVYFFHIYTYPIYIYTCSRPLSGKSESQRKVARPEARPTRSRVSQRTRLLPTPFQGKRASITSTRSRLECSSARLASSFCVHAQSDLTAKADAKKARLAVCGGGEAGCGGGDCGEGEG